MNTHVSFSTRRRRSVIAVWSTITALITGTPSRSDGLSEVEALELLDDDLAKRLAQYLIDSGLSPEEAAEVVVREFKPTELDFLWLRYQTDDQEGSQSGTASDPRVLVAAGAVSAEHGIEAG